jgi:hypothetical protein
VYTLEDYDPDQMDDGNYSGMPGHEPEIGFTTKYCPDCNITYELRSVAYPGGRESEPLACPDCHKLLGGNIETESTVIKRTSGDTGSHGFMTEAYKAASETS